MTKSKKTAIIEEYHCCDHYGEDCDNDCNYCKECLESDINDFENQIRADERSKVLNEFANWLKEKGIYGSKEFTRIIHMYEDELKEQRN